MGLISEWKAFAAFADDNLGMPADTMPLYTPDKKWSRKARHILDFVIESGNFGHNREFKRSKHFLIGKVQALLFKLRDFLRHARVFPLDSMLFFFHYFIGALTTAKESRATNHVLE